jgi:hypothetical protein
MTGETDLSRLIREMRPELNDGEFVFCQVDSTAQASELDPLCMFAEMESVTVILPRQKADEVGLPYPVVCAWITLTVHSSLEAVGLTAAVSNALTVENISCNVVAAFHHDHLFVPIESARRAMEVLIKLSG